MNAFFLLKGKESRPIPRLAIKTAARYLAGVSAAEAHTKWRGTKALTSRKSQKVRNKTILSVARDGEGDEMDLQQSG